MMYRIALSTSAALALVMTSAPLLAQEESSAEGGEDVQQMIEDLPPLTPEQEARQGG